MPLKILHNDFYITKNEVYDPCAFQITELNAEEESQEYGACNFILNGKKIKFRVFLKFHIL